MQKFPLPRTPFPSKLLLAFSYYNVLFKTFIGMSLFMRYFLSFFNLVQMRVEMGAEVRKLMQGVLPRYCNAKNA